MKPDLETMNMTDLRSYVLEHREDSPEARLRQREAFQALMDRLNANAPTTIYPCPNTPENTEIMKKAIREKLGK
jgi:mannitol-1-phosphate/altronate dehydrogenase